VLPLAWFRCNLYGIIFQIISGAAMHTDEYEISTTIFHYFLRWSRMLIIAVAILFPTMTEAEEIIEGCYPLTIEDITKFNVPQFDDYPVKTTFKGKPTHPDVRTQAHARRFRTMLRIGAARGPNFSGHYTVVGWGCGTSCLEFAIVDAKTGKVFFPPGIPYIDGHSVALGPGEAMPEFITIRYRLDSRLLVLLGAPGEDESRAGITYLEWTGASLKQLCFIASHKRLCPNDQSPKALRSRQKIPKGGE
jgi:hypothetical protein